MSNKNGVVKDIKHMKIIRSLPSMYYLKILVNIGDQLLTTVSSSSTSGYSVLINPDLSVLEADYRSVVAIQDDLFDVSSPFISLAIRDESFPSSTAHADGQPIVRHLIHCLTSQLNKCERNIFYLWRRFFLFCWNAKQLRSFVKRFMVLLVSFYVFSHIVGLSAPLFVRKPKI
jgi:hypothetical protein